MPFLAFEGLDGSGKSQLAQRLAAALRAQSHTVIATREPGGAPLSETIRQWLLLPSAQKRSPRCELLLFEAARAEHVDQVIRPALHQDKTSPTPVWILCDRFTSSSLAFQHFAQGLNRQDVEMLNHFATDGVQPDLEILIDVPTAVSQKRREIRLEREGGSLERFEVEPEDFHTRVRQGFLQLAAENPERWLVLQGESTPDALLQQLWQELKRKWPALLAKERVNP